MTRHFQTAFEYLPAIGCVKDIEARAPKAQTARAARRR
jgi:hypothetical protein